MILEQTAATVNQNDLRLSCKENAEKPRAKKEYVVIERTPDFIPKNERAAAQDVYYQVVGMINGKIVERGGIFETRSLAEWACKEDD